MHIPQSSDATPSPVSMGGGRHLSNQLPPGDRWTACKVWPSSRKGTNARAPQSTIATAFVICCLACFLHACHQIKTKDPCSVTFSVWHSTEAVCVTFCCLEVHFSHCRMLLLSCMHGHQNTMQTCSSVMFGCLGAHGSQLCHAWCMALCPSCCRLLLS